MEENHPTPLHNQLRHYRQLAGLSQNQLAEQAGVTRQAISLIESGQNIPSVLVALRLARIFCLPVEDLFSLPPDNQDIWHTPEGTEVQPGDRVLPAIIGERKVAHRLDILAQPQMLPQISEALTVAETIPGNQIRVAHPGKTITADWTIVSGCDIGLALLTGHSASGEVMRQTRSLWLNADNSKAIRQLLAGDVHIAAVHSPAISDGQVRDCGMDIRKVRFACSELGWIVKHGNPLGFRGAADLLEKSFRLVNRPPGAGARRLLDRLLAEAQIDPKMVSQYHFTVSGHLQVAQAISEGLADIGIGIASAATAARLDFLPIQQETCDLWIPSAYLQLDGVQRILQTLSSDVFRRDLRSFGPYDVHKTGQMIT